MATTSWRLLSLALLALAACGTTGTTGLTGTAGTPSTTGTAGRRDPRGPGPADRAEARRLATGGRLDEAVAMYERLLAQSPDDARLCVEAAGPMLELANRKPSAEQARPLRRRARALLLHARQLGDDSPFIDSVVQGVDEEGEVIARRGRFSTRPEVDRAVREGEEAFERGDNEGALAGYRRALELEPGNYFATLWTGDVYFKVQEWDAAAEWFRKAVALQPDVETAHRYLGDVLRRLGRHDEALDEYVEALIADPQNDYPRHALRSYVQNMRKPPIPELPRDRVELRGVRVELAGPDGRRGLAEQAAGLRRIADLQADDAVWQERIIRLGAIRDAGLLEAYVVFERFTPDVGRDYPAYRAAHRKELRRYVRTYWCGLG